MSNTNVLRDRLCQHYRQIGLSGKQASRLSSLCKLWIDESGSQFFVDRVKSLASAWKASIAEESSSQYGIYIPDGFRTRKNRKGERIFADNLLHRLFTLDSSHENNLVLVQAVFRSFTLCVSDFTTRKQFSKFIDAVTSPQTNEEKVATDIVSERCYETTKHIFRPVSKSGLGDVGTLPLSHFSVSRNKRSPVIKGVEDFYFKSDYQGAILKTEARTSISTKNFLDVLGCDKQWSKLWSKYPQEFSECILGNHSLDIILGQTENMVDYPVGTMSFIQEGGNKLRAVANPFLAIQALAEPLKRKLELLSTYLTNCYTFDQDAGRERIADTLSEGKTVYAFDASSFTDRFPYALQRRVLEALLELDLVSQFDIDVFDTVVSKGYQCNVDGVVLPFNVKYEVGQPQGFGPSFHLACISHAMVAYSSRVSGVTDSFVVVGDDIAIFDKKVADYYANNMRSIGVDINIQKSIISPKFSEFCGKIISENGPTRSMKVKYLLNDDNILSNLAFYGPRGLTYLTDSELAKAVKLLLPSDLGGLDINTDFVTAKEIYDLYKTDNIWHTQSIKELDEVLDPNSRVSVSASLEHLSEFYETLPYDMLTDAELDSHYNDRLNHSILTDKDGCIVRNQFSGTPVWSTGVGHTITDDLSRDYSMASHILLLEMNALRQALSNDSTSLVKDEELSTKEKIITKVISHINNDNSLRQYSKESKQRMEEIQTYLIGTRYGHLGQSRSLSYMCGKAFSSFPTIYQTTADEVLRNTLDYLVKSEHIDAEMEEHIESLTRQGDSRVKLESSILGDKSLSSEIVKQIEKEHRKRAFDSSLRRHIRVEQAQLKLQNKGNVNEQRSKRQERRTESKSERKNQSQGRKP